MGILDKFADGLRDKLKGDIEELVKSEVDKLPEKPQNLEENGDSLGGKAIIDDPFFDHATQHFVHRTKMSRVSNKTLKDVSLRDWLVSAIVQCRADTMLRFSRVEHRRFEMGFHFTKRDHNAAYTDEDRSNIAMLEDFIYHCGRTDKVPPGQEMLFGQFLKLTLRDALTFGHVAVEKVLTKRGAVHRFRPLPAESVYMINKRTQREIVEREVESARQQYELKMRQLNNDPASKFPPPPRDIDYFKYVQMSYDNRVLSAFGDEDMIFKLFNPQNFADSLGYCYSPLELAIINITNHLNVENYNANFFTHGFAARGILHLKGTVTQSNLASFRRQFYNSISGTQHAWRTPIVSGLEDVQWVPMSASAREMEYINFNHHLMRTICTQFQIDPVELGLDFLTSPNGRSASQQANNEYKINYSRERGLYPILMFFEDLINCDIIPALDKDLASQYEFKFAGYTDETPQTDVALKQAQMTVFSSMNDLLKDAKKDPIDHPIGDLPLNAAFWQVAERMMTRGELRALFLDDKEALGKRELAYLPGDAAFMGWNQFILTMDRMKKQDAQQQQQMQAQQQQADREHQLNAGQHNREQEQHELAMREANSRHAQAAVQGSSESLKDVAKDVGAASKALQGPGGPMANPINTMGG